MIHLIFILNIFFAHGDNISKIAQANNAKKNAEKAFIEKDYSKAIKNYHILLDSLAYSDENAQLNLAHAYFLTEDTANSFKIYKNIISNSSNKNTKSIAQQQMGNILAKQTKFEESLQHYKLAIKENPQNLGARYDYELVKKMLEQQKQNQDKNQENKDQKDNQENKEEEKQDNKDQEKEGIGISRGF